MLELDNVDLMKTSVNLNFGEQLGNETLGFLFTFCLALLLDKELFWMILAAITFLVSRFTNSKHLANPPLPRSRPLEYFLTAVSPLTVEILSSIITFWSESVLQKIKGTSMGYFTGLNLPYPLPGRDFHRRCLYFLLPFEFKREYILIRIIIYTSNNKN